MYTVLVVRSKITSDMTASRTITLTISDWARLEEIRIYREIMDLPGVLKYIIRAEASIVHDKQQRDNQYISELAEIKGN